MKVVKIPMELIRANPIGRAIDKKTVSVLAQSMKEVGLLNPITVVQVLITGWGRADNVGYRILAGAHRLEAAKLLGWEEIEAYVFDCDGNDGRRHRLIEITENLHRAELPVLERDRLVAEWCELVGGEKPRQPDAVSGGRGNEGGQRHAARQLGLSEPDVRRARKVAALSGPAQEKARELGLDDNRTALLEAARENEPEEQVRKLEQRSERTPEPVSKVDKVLEMVRAFSMDEILELLAKLTGIVEARR